MTTRGLKIALVALVLINVFALAALGTTLVQLHRVETRLEAEARPSAEHRSPRRLMGSLDPEVRARVGESMRTSALAAKPDFDEARRLRREAIAALAAPDYDAATVSDLLERSRAAELRGRKRLEDDALAMMATLEPEDREKLAPLLARSGRSRGGGRRERVPEPGPPD
jgi:uncharacterized membrane protein